MDARAPRAYGIGMRLDDQIRRQLVSARELLECESAAPSVPDIARSVGMSPFHFIRVFQAAFGVTPHRYRGRVRLERARYLLARGTSVTETCMQLGFSSLGSFSTLFVNAVGEAPSRYQRRVRVSVQVPGDLVRRFNPGCVSLLGLLPADAFRNFREA